MSRRNSLNGLSGTIVFVVCFPSFFWMPNRERIVSNRWLSLLVVLCASISGCGEEVGGPDLAEVSGTVNYQGKPLAGANVTMVSAGGHLSTGSTTADGKFKMTTGGRLGVPLGKAKVGVSKVAAAEVNIDVASMKPEDMQKMQIEGGGKAKDLTPKSEIPEKYANPDKSGFVADVVADVKKNAFTYDLVD